MTGTFKVATISYKNAPLEIREKLVLDKAQSLSFLDKIKETLNTKEALVLSTCNRTEVYYKSEKTQTREIVKLLASEKNLSPNELLVYFEEIINEHNTIKYLFEVSLGIHAQIVGDQQIISQVKEAYQNSCEAKLAGAFLHKLLNTIFLANKRVVQETSFKDGAASTTFVTLEILESFINLIPSVKILVLGLGEIGTDIAKSLFERGYKDICLSNRTLSKTIEIATELDYKVLPFEDLKHSFIDYSVIISSVRADDYVLPDADLLQKDRLSYVFDLSIPRSVSPLVENADHIVLYTLDEIQKKRDEGVKAREAAIPQVKDIIAQLTSELELWSRELLVAPTIQKLKTSLDQIRLEEINRHSKNLSHAEIETLEKFSQTLIQKLLKSPVISLKEACKKGDTESLINTIEKLFNLE